MKRPAVFFDRDNTLIANDGYLGDPGGVVLIEGAAQAVARARRLGFAVVTVSNQSGVARGMFTEQAVHSVNARMDELLSDQDAAARIDRHEFCPFHPDAYLERYRQESSLRKPKPGMILQAADRLDLDLPASWLIGDAARDIEAGKAAGCRTILFRDPAINPSPEAARSSDEEPDFVVNSLHHAIDIIERHTMNPTAIETDPTASTAEPDRSEPPTTAPPQETGAAASEVVRQETGGAASEVVRYEPAPSHPAGPESATTEPAPPTLPARDVGQGLTTSATHAATVATTIAGPTGDGPGSTPASTAQPATSAGTSESVGAGAPAQDRTTPEVASESAPAGPPRKMTFAERVRAGTFQPARPGTVPAPALVEKPRKAPLIPAERSPADAGAAPNPAAAPIAASDAPSDPHTSPSPAVRATEPLSLQEQVEPLLREILEELRLIREHRPSSDFSVTKLLSGLMQVLVLPVLFFAYLHRQSPPELLAMLVFAVFLQALTLTLLVMGRQQ